MSDFSDAIAVLDTIAGIANNVAKTRHDYIIDNKRTELQEEKWEHQKDTAEFNQNNALLNDYQKNINSNMTAEAYDDAYESMKEFSGTLTNPKLQEKAQTMLDSKTQIGQTIDSKDDWQANVERIFADYEGIQDEFKSNNFAGTNHMVELAKEMRAGVLANQKFFDSADNSRFERMGKEIENYADAANYISQYDADADLTKFDIEQGYKDFEFVDPHTGYVHNEYSQVMEAVDLLKSGNVDEALRAISKVSDRYGKDMAKTVDKIYDYRKGRMAELYRNEDVNETVNARTNGQGKKLIRISQLHGISSDYNDQLNMAETRGEQERVNAERANAVEMFRQKYYMSGDKGARIFEEEIYMVNNGLFDPTEFKNWDDITRQNMEEYNSQTTAALEGEVVGARTDYMDALTVAIGKDNPAIDKGLQTIIKNKSLTLYPEITSVESDIAGAPRINRYNEAMAGPSRLLSGLFVPFMDESQGVGATGPDDLYVAKDMENLRNEDKSPSVQRLRQRVTYRMYNNIFWGGAQTENEVAEQLGVNPFSGYGTGEAEQGALELIRAGRTYYNEMFTNKLISQHKHGGEKGQKDSRDDLTSLLNNLTSERRGVKKQLDTNKVHKGDISKIQNDVYNDVLGTSQNPIWKDMLRQLYIDNVNGKGPGSEVYTLAYWQSQGDLTSAKNFDELKAMFTGTEEAKATWAHEFQKASPAYKEDLLEQRKYADVPLFLL